MSITIQQEPSQMNSAYTKLLYSVVSSNIGEPQFKYVCDVKDDNGNLISRLRQGLTQANNAIFDVAVPCRAQLQEDQTFYITDPTASIGQDSPDIINSYKQFKIAFGEEYSTSISSSVTIYDGNGSAGNPGVSGSDLVLNRAVWEPWNEQQFMSSSAAPVYTNSGTGSFNFYVYEAAGVDYVDVNLRVNGAYVPASLYGGSGSFAYSASTDADLSLGNGYYDLAVTSFGVSSSAERYSMEIYNMSNNTMVYQTSQGSTLPAGYASGSVGGPQTIDTYSFTASLNNVYGLRLNGIPTSSFTAPLFQAYYVSNNYTASSDRMRSITYPLTSSNVVGVGGYPDTKAWEVTSNSISGSNVGDIDSAYPTLQDFSKANIPSLTPLPSGNFGSWNWNYQDSRINFTGSNPDYGGGDYSKLFLTNWPSFVRNWQTGKILDLQTPKPIAANDWGTLSYYNISGSAKNDPSSRAMQFNLMEITSSSTSPTLRSNVPYSEAQLNALTPLLTQSGSGADIPFVTIPGAPRNVPLFAPVTGSSNWNFMMVQIGPGSETARFWMLRDEPCDYETRSNFAFINKWGVWDFIGMNTPTNKNAVINERSEFMQVNADYNSQLSEYSAYNRGFTQYYMNQNYKYKITTDPIPVTNLTNDLGMIMSGGVITAISDYYQELFQSPSVFLQVDDTFIPINITRNNFTYRTNIRGQKKYQVTIEYELSNKPRSRT